MISGRTLNSEEKSLAKKHPAKARKTLKLAIKAMFEERVRYWDDGEDSGNSNAFLHTYWSALIVKNISQEWATQWTDAHEKNDRTLNSQMDISNNKLGMKIAGVLKEVSNDTLANKIEDIIDSGKGVKIKNNKLVPTTKNNKRNLNIFEAIIQKALSIISRLIAKNKTNIKNMDGMTPLIFAVQENYIDAITLLIKSSNLEEKDSYGESAIFHACRLKDIEALKIILNAGCDVNCKSSDYEETPLMEAVENKNIEHAKLLLAYGADKNAKSSWNYTAYNLAESEGIHKLFHFLKSKV